VKLNVWRFLLAYGIVSLIFTFGVVGFIVGTLLYIPTGETGYIGVMSFFNPFFTSRNMSEGASMIFMLWPVAIVSFALYKQRQDIKKLM